MREARLFNPPQEEAGEKSALLEKQVTIAGGHLMNLSAVREYYRQYDALLTALYQQSSLARELVKPERESLVLGEFELDDETYAKYKRRTLAVTTCSVSSLTLGAAFTWAVKGSATALGYALMGFGGLPVVLCAGWGSAEMGHCFVHQCKNVRFGRNEAKARAILTKIVGEVSQDSWQYGTQAEKLTMFRSKLAAWNNKQDVLAEVEVTAPEPFIMPAHTG